MFKVANNKTPSDISTEHHDNMANHFDQNYSHYDSDIYYNAFTYGRSKIDKELIKVIKKIPASSKVLDLGCGTGDQLKILKKYNLDYYGIDPAPSMVDIARKRVASHDKIQNGIAQNIPFSDNSFDLVIMIEVVRYLDLKDINKSFSEVSRVLKPGGKIFCTFVNKWSLDFFYLFQNLRKIFKRNNYDTKNPYCEFFTPNKVKRLYEINNFKNIEIIGNMFSPIRIVYKINRKFGSILAKKLTNFDDQISNKEIMKRFSGHLIAVAELD